MVDKELQRQTLFVQLKILKELRLLNKNMEKQRIANGEYTTILRQGEFEDVKEAISATGRNFI